MKALIFILAIISSFQSYCQLEEVKFREQGFENGMNYPQVIVPSDKEVENSINANILERVSDLEKSDFCIGQYGYVQKGAHLQIHVFCNCIDFESSENRYFLYNLENGKAVPSTDIINHKKYDEAASYLLERTKAHLLAKSIEVNKELSDNINKSSLDVFRIVLKRDGIDLWIDDMKDWGTEPMFVSWMDFKSFLKFHYL